MATVETNLYPLPRGRHEAQRLEEQHQWIMSCQGYYLHPNIQIPATNAKIADLCAGTAIWLREVAHYLPDAELHGFDISDVMFPDRTSSPANLAMHVQDVKKAFDARWIGYFDVIHVRLIESAMDLNEWAPLLQNILTLLKPGGWLQWVEDDRATSLRRGCRRAAPADALKDSFSQANGRSPQWQPVQVAHIPAMARPTISDDKALGMNYAWMNLDVLMADVNIGNLDQVGCDAFPIDREGDGGQLRAAWTKQGLLAKENILRESERNGKKLTNVDIDEWIKSALKEIDLGAYSLSRISVFFGQKRLS